MKLKIEIENSSKLINKQKEEIQIIQELENTITRLTIEKEENNKKLEEITNEKNRIEMELKKLYENFEKNKDENSKSNNEKDKIIESFWDTENGRRRKYYKITKKGLLELKSRENEWKLFSKTMNLVLGGEY